MLARFGLGVFFSGATFMLGYGLSIITGSQIATQWGHYGYHIAMATMTIGIGLLVTKNI